MGKAKVYKIPIVTKCAHCPEYYASMHLCQLLNRRVDGDIWYKSIPEWCPLPDAETIPIGPDAGGVEMKIDEFLEELKKQPRADIKLDVAIGEVDIHAINVLQYLYDNLGKGANFADVERVLNEAMFWHITLNTLIGD